MASHPVEKARPAPRSRFAASDLVARLPKDIGLAEPFAVGFARSFYHFFASTLDRGLYRVVTLTARTQAKSARLFATVYQRILATIVDAPCHRRRVAPEQENQAT